MVSQRINIFFTLDILNFTCVFLSKISVVFCSYLQLLRTGPARETYGMDGGVAKKELGQEDIAFQDRSFNKS